MLEYSSNLIAMSNSNNNKSGAEKLVTKRLSVHVVYLSCPDCQHEVEHIEMCPKCSTPMKVVDVVEKFGTEAQQLIEKIKEGKVSQALELEDDDTPNIIIISEEDQESVLNGDDDDDTITEEEVTELDDIFASEDDDDIIAPSNADDDLGSLLDEEEDQSFGDIDIDPEELPEL
jgi:hypothetical protein